MLRQFLIASLALSASLAAGQAPVGTDQRARLGREGATLGRSLAAGAAAATLEEGGEGAAGVLRIQGQDSIEVQELVPGARKAGADSLRNMEGQTLDEMRGAADEQRRRDSGDPGSYGRAWREVVGAQKTREAAVLGDRALWQQSQGALAAATTGVVGNTLTSCVVQQDDGPTGGLFVGRTEERVCEQLHRQDRCTRTREVDVQVEENVQVGSYANPTLGGPVIVEGQLSPSTPVTGASIHVSFVPQILIATVEEQPTQANEFSWRVRLEPAPAACNGVAGCTVDAQATIFANLQRLRSTFESVPNNCLLESDEFCTAVWQCVDSDPRTIGGLLIDANSPVASDPLYPGAQGLCWRADATYDCPLTVGQFCYTNPSGQEVCSSTPPGGGSDNTCAVLDQDLRCHEVRRACSEDGGGHGGFCYVETVTYECLIPSPVEDRSVITKNVCTQDIPCMGNACVPADIGREYQGNSWVRTQATLMLAQHLMSDYKHDQAAAVADRANPGARAAAIKAITQKATAAVAPSATVAEAAAQTLYRDTDGPGPGQPDLSAVNAMGSPGIRFFPGKSEQCAKQLGGIVDCCTNTESTAESLWLGLYQTQLAKSNLKRAAQEANTGAREQSGYKSLQEGDVSDQVLDRGLVSATDTATGESSGFTGATSSSAGDGSMAGLQDQFIREANRTIRPNLSWGCPTRAYDLAAQKEVGSCLHVGSYCKRSVFGACLDKRDSYCCFSSPLSKAVRLHLAGGSQAVAQGAFGTARQPRCEGLPLETLAEGQWDRLDLTDAIARLNLASMFPRTDAERRAKTNIQRLTGAQSALGDAQREDGEARGRRRLSSFDGGAVRRTIETQQRELMPGAIADPESPGTLGLVPGWQVIDQGARAAVAVSRSAGQGAVSVAYRVYSDGGREDARPGIDFEPAQGQLNWAAGDVTEKSIVVRSFNAQNAEGPVGTKRTVRVALSDPRGGAMLGEIPIGKVILKWVSAAPRPVESNELNLAVSKEFLGTVLDNGNLFADWRINVVNGGSVDVFDLFVTDFLPRNEDFASLRAVPGDDSFERYCRRASGGPAADGDGQVAYCILFRTGTVFEAGARLSFIVRGRVRAGGVHRNTCEVRASGIGADGIFRRTRITAFSCVADGAVEAPPSNGGGGAECASRPPPSGWVGVAPTTNDLFGSGFPSAPIDWARLAIAPTTYVRAPMPLQSSGFGILVVRRASGSFASHSRIAISDCAGDLGLAVAGTVALDPACRFAGNISADGVRLRVSIGDDIPGTCVLDPDRTYFLNVGHLDAAGVADTCAVGETCPVEVRSQIQ